MTMLGQVPCRLGDDEPPIMQSAMEGANGTRQPVLPGPRGPLSEHLLQRLVLEPHTLPAAPPVGDVLGDDDAQLALYCCYELHYRSFEAVDESWEWEPSLLAFRRSIETAFEERLADELGTWAPVHGTGGVEDALASVVNATAGPSLSRHMVERGTLEQLREFAIHRSAYQLKEADPHTWGIPRLHGRPKAALVEIQLDEYGGGVETEMHSTLFAATMEALDLDTRYGAYLDRLPAATLATSNLVSLFGLHRRWRGALAGHLAVFESTSVGPMGRYALALRRLGLGPAARRFYDVHVAADSHHKVVACTALAGGLAAAEPDLVADIVFGARALMLVEQRFTRHLLVAWEAGRSSLVGRSSPPAQASADRR